MNKFAVLCAIVFCCAGANSCAAAKTLATYGICNDAVYTEPQVDEYNKSIGISKKALHYLELGNVESRKGAFKKAIWFFDSAIELNPKYASAFNNRGNAYDFLGDTAAAVSDYKAAIKLNPKFAAPWNNLAYFHNNLRERLSDYDQSIRLYPNNCVVFEERAFVKCLLGDTQGAMPDYNEALKLNPKYPRAYANRGHLSHRLNRLQDALIDLNQAIKLEPTYAQAYEWRGQVFSELELFANALVDLNEAVRLDPTNSQYYRSRAYARADDCGDLHGAVEDMSKTIAFNPNDGLNYFIRGSFRSRVGDIGGAIADLSQGLQLDSHEHKLDSWYHCSKYCDCAELRLEVGDYCGAVRDYDFAIRLNRDSALHRLNWHISKLLSQTKSNISACAENLWLKLQIGFYIGGQ